MGCVNRVVTYCIVAAFNFGAVMYDVMCVGIARRCQYICIHVRYVALALLHAHSTRTHARTHTRIHAHTCMGERKKEGALLAESDSSSSQLKDTCSYVVLCGLDPHMLEV